ncbi:UDP-glucuronosyltransferase [Hippoglossus hippoglossus]|uniref:UDP-glucuronosyltransferase n=1 Tax=Hippoglossus hippoglossus TaxID=8267 RepID=UPI00148DBD93|nr:UDP-glucuronosyltransferase [Hippoglossus hippoglossus]
MSGRVWFPMLGLVAWLCFLSLGPVQGGKVLVMPADGSHWLSLKILVKGLIHRGHDVLVLVPESSMLMHESEDYKTEMYQVSFTKDEMDATLQQLKDSLFLNPPDWRDYFVNIKRFVNFTSLHLRGCESLLLNQPLMSRMKGMGFDIVLTDPFIPCGAIVGHIFSIPVVNFLRGLPCELDMKANKCPTPPSYVPMFHSGNTNIMTFPQRVKNMAMSVVESYSCSLLFGHYDEMVSKYLGNNMDYKTLLSHGALWLLRNEFTLDWPRPLLPNMVLIGGINCAEKKKKAPLPADLEEFVEGSGDDGFIVFTLGSMVPDMPEDKAQHFLDAFRQIPQRVVWRYAGVPPEGVPKNVRLMKWLPQRDLLAHPKAKLFITHGGSHSVYEGICNAVPLLMFPLFAEQGDNGLRMVTRGVAETLNIFDLTSDKLLAAVNKILQNKSYKEKIAELSQIHQDRPVAPLDLAVFWTEFVIRHKGAAHLRVAAHDLNWIQLHSLDVIGFILLILLTVLWVTLKCCLFCTRRCFRRGTAKTKSE